MHNVMEKALRETQTQRALAVRTLPARPLQRPPATDRTDYNTLRREA